MTTSIVDAESVLAIDLGSVHTRAALFDVVDGQYRFIASGTAPCTLNAPFRDIEESVHQALGQLTNVTGRMFVDPESMQLIVPARSGGQGADCLVITYSAGPELRVLTAGLLGDVSLESAQRLVNTISGKVVESIGLTDHRRTDVQLDAILKAEPDVILLTGGTENGASRSVFKMVDVINLALRVLPRERRPHVLYAGNQVLGKKIKEILDQRTTVTLAPNVRPSIDQENLDPAAEALARVMTEVRYRQLGGLERLARLSAQAPMPTAYAFGRVVRFLSKLYDPVKGVLGVDVGGSATSIAAGSGGHLAANVFPYGTGTGAARLLAEGSLPGMMQWLPAGVSESIVRDTLWQKSLFPGSLPVTAEALAIEQAAVRQLLQLGLRQLLQRFPTIGMAFEPILASGAALSGAASPAQALLMLLDGIQPVGVTTLILDQNNLIPSLGAIAALNPVLPVQLLESNAFLNLGTVICPISRARNGTPVLRVELEVEEGNKSQVDVQQGSLVSLPLRPGQPARIHLQALRPVEIDSRGKRGLGSFKIVGGALGVVIDARGRPIRLPKDDAKRTDVLKKWAASLGSE